MKKFFFCMMMVMTAGAAHAADAFTLKECYDMALGRSESIAIQKEYIRETEGLILQSLSTALPKVAFAYSEKWQDVQGNNTLSGSTPEGKFTFSQPLFTGFKEFAAIAGSRHIGKQRAQELKRAQELLFTDVADAFYLYLSYQEDLDVLAKVQGVLEDRVAELQRRQKIGKSRPGEVAGAEAKLRKTEAAVESVRGQQETAGQLLEFLIGRPFERLVAEDIPAGEVDLQALYLKADDRADVVAARESFASYKNNVTAARSQFLPAVTLSGNSYTQRKGTSAGNDWDVTLGVNVPLFNGLGDFGSVRQARAQATEADLRLSQARRKALLEIRAAYTRWRTAGRRLKALDLSAEASEKNYTLQAADFQKSLVSNLDVLQALEDWQNARRDQAAARSDAARAYWAMQVATGGM